MGAVDERILVSPLSMEKRRLLSLNIMVYDKR